MFSRLAVRLPKASGLNGVSSLSARLPGQQARFISRPAMTGSKGRTMPAMSNRATAAATGAEATLTIRVRLCSSMSILVNSIF